MLELRSTAALLIENPLVPVPPLEGVVARARRYRAARVRKQMGAGVALVSLVLAAVVNAGLGGGQPDSLRMVGDPPLHDEEAAGVHFDYPTTTLLPDNTSLLLYSGQSFEGDWSGLRSSTRQCPARVDDKLPAVKIMASDDNPSIDGQNAYEVVRRIGDVYNFVGGICGRAIHVVKGQFGNPYYAKQTNDVLAVVGAPLDGALDARIAGGTVDELGVPVVGGDGLSEVQHRSRLVYPIGTSAAALTRIAVERARSAGAHTFAVVYDSTLPFAVEAANSFAAYLARVPGTVKATIDLGEPTGLATGPERFRQACNDDKCDFVFLALKSDTAQGWLQTRPAKARLETAALPTLLTGGFPESCFHTSNDRCNGIAAWTGLLPWFETNNDLFEMLDENGTGIHTLKAGALMEGTALGAQVLIEALLEAGPGVTRKTLRSILETRSFTAYPGVKLQWGTRLPRAGIPTAQPWRLEVDDVATWGARIKETSTERRTRVDEANAGWLDDIAVWADDTRSWPAETAERAGAFDAHAWREALAQWAAYVPEWAEDAEDRAATPLPTANKRDLEDWTEYMAPDPRWASTAPVPQLTLFPWTPAPPHQVESPSMPMPNKWWRAADEGRRSDPE